MPQDSGTKVQSNKDGSITVDYRPKEKGMHEVSLLYNDQPVNGSPYHFVVDSSGSGYITAYGEGLNVGHCGKETTFNIVANAKDIDIIIDGPGKAEILKKVEKDGCLEVVYLPPSPGEYHIFIKHKGQAILSSPFQVKISGEGSKRSQLSSQASSVYVLCGGEVDLANMQGVIETPSGTQEVCLLKKTEEGKLAVASFQPKKKGTYVVEVCHEGLAIKGSPFKIDVGDNQICHAAGVHVTGAIKEATANKWNHVTIDISDAGYGSMSISAEGAHRSDMEIKNPEKNEYILGYKPHEPGIYLLSIRFADEHITGSPFLVSVGGQMSGRVRETVHRAIEVSKVVKVGQKCDLDLMLPGINPIDLDASITSPDGSSESCESRDKSNFKFEINFKPCIEGMHRLSLKNKGIHMPGSPFQYTVGKELTSTGAHKVEFGGTGIDGGEISIKNFFNVYTREAGAGNLSVAVEGPSKAEIIIEENANGFTFVSYCVSKEGEYGIHVKYDDIHVPHSPAFVRISPSCKDARLVTLHGLRDRGLEIDRPVSLNVHLNGAVGQLKSVVKMPNGQLEDVYVQELEQDLFSLRFFPKENGVYYLFVRFNETNITGSPFPLLAGKLGADPALVFAKGEGLERGEVGKPTKFYVTTLNAGAGVLSVHIEGTSRVAVVCSEGEDGYEFTYTPMAPGCYFVNLRFCSVNIAGSPFKVIVTGKGKASEILESSSLFVDTVEKKPGVQKAKRLYGDASKVVANGNGIKKAVPGRPSNFTLDCKEAGQALLTIGMISPSGHPVTELTYKKQRANIYQVIYNAQEKGQHTLMIRWGQDDIPGSPFNIVVG